MLIIHNYHIEGNPFIIRFKTAKEEELASDVKPGDIEGNHL